MVSTISIAAREFWVVVVVAVAVVPALGCSAPAPDGAPGFTLDRSTAGCVEGDREAQRFGTDCLCCHKSELSVAGSIARDSAPVERVIVEDDFGHSAVMTPNAFGNFFRHSTLVPPLRARIIGVDGRVATMPGTAPDAACNRCHREGGEASMLRAQ